MILEKYFQIRASTEASNTTLKDCAGTLETAMKSLNIRGDLCSCCQYHDQTVAATTRWNLATSVILINIVKAPENIVLLLYFWHFDKTSKAQFILALSSNALGKTDLVS